MVSRRITESHRNSTVEKSFLSLSVTQCCLIISVSDDNLAHVFHLGRCGTSDDAPRPLMVELASYTHKKFDNGITV